MRYDAGLGVSLGETGIRIVDETGAITKESVCLSDPDALARAFADRIGAGAGRVGGVPADRLAS